MHDDLKEKVLARLAGDGVERLLASLGHQVRQSGRELKIICPFHDDHDPSFSINMQKGKNGAGVFKCFPCGWGGDCFSFVQESQNLTGFRDALKLMANILGIPVDGEVRREGAPVPIRESQARKIATLTAGEIADDLQAYRDRALDAEKWCAKLGLTAKGLELCGGIISTYRKYGQIEAAGMPVMVVPQRKAPDGILSSLRIASFEPRRKWSHDRKATIDGEEVQTHRSEGGLMAPQWQWDAPPNEFQMSIVVEGESDMLAGVDMMLPYGSGPVSGEDEGGAGFEEWPARWWGLPGVSSCHDQLVPEILGNNVVFMFDPDQGGMGAAFDRRRKVKDRHTGSYKIDLDGEMLPGVIRKARERGMNAVACFPPQLHGQTKSDVRRLKQAGWDWTMLFEHIVANPRGLVA